MMIRIAKKNKKTNSCSVENTTIVTDATAAVTNRQERQLVSFSSSHICFLWDFFFFFFSFSQFMAKNKKIIYLLRKAVAH